ncbi:MAG: hypothetical protein IJG84_03470 [Kiritimatiellae bacterium]|nr:hypothetical protein [Kiritimatiellia bacterium]
MQGVKFKLSELPPHLRMQAERQIATSINPRLKAQPKPQPPPPIRVPKQRTPNKTEARYDADHGGGGLYEALSFKVPSGRYTPDWTYFNPDGSIRCVEVKGGHAFGSQAASAAKFKEAVSAYPAVEWVWAKWDGKCWQCANYLGRVSIRDEAANAPR